MLTEEACFPTITHEERAWYFFHSKLLRKDKESYGKVIGVLEEMIEVINEKKPWFSWTFSGEETNSFKVKYSDIEKHVFNYLNSMILNAEKQDQYKFINNTLNNILRCLKRIRNDEAPFQLPQEDKELTMGLIDRLSSPPSEDYFISTLLKRTKY